MQSSNAAETTAFWEYVSRRQRFRVQGSGTISWDTFAAYFETYMQDTYPSELARTAPEPSAGMVLRYAFDRGDPARAATSRVEPRDLKLFLERFGPMKSCLTKASRSLFNESGCLEPWFHGMMSRDDASRAISNWNPRERRQAGLFLCRYTSNKADIVFSYRRKPNGTVQHSLIHNSERGYCPEQEQEGGDSYPYLRKFFSAMDRLFAQPIVSALHLECQAEIDGRTNCGEQSPPLEGSTPSVMRQLRFMTPSSDMLTRRAGYDLDTPAEQLALACSEGVDEAETARIHEEALAMVKKVVSVVQRSNEPQLEAKALRLKADLLWKLGYEEEGVASALICLDVIDRAQQTQDSPMLASGIPCHVHQLLTGYFLRKRMQSQALHHFSELIACTTDEDTRQQRVREFQQVEEFRRATARISHRSVEEMLEEGITYFCRNEYAPAGEKFEKALRDARCIGEGKLEARALGNVATVDYKTHRIPAAIRRYRTCVQLLRQLRDQVTERKILNYLVMCCIEARRWTWAKRFHEQLSQLAESKDNILHLQRLEARIQEGMDAQAAAETHSTAAGGTEPARTSPPLPEPPAYGEQRLRGGGYGGYGHR